MKIAIAGFGVEGQASYNYYSSQDGSQITIVDQKIPDNLPQGVRTIIGEDAFSNLNGFDLVLRSPGIPLNKLKTDGKVWSATNEFFKQTPAPIIGVTGTKGKGTVSSLITSILQKAGKKVWLVGNIGLAALEVLPDITPQDIVVYELSSFQLWDIEYSPQTAVVLFLEPEHLNIHKDENCYYQAKANIFKHQTKENGLVYFKDNTQLSLQDSPAKKYPFRDKRYAHIQDDCFYYNNIMIGPISSFKLLGEHNLDNACAAINAVWPYTQNIEAIHEGLISFKGLPHRLHKVKTVNGVHYYDDSIATTPAATIAALKALMGPKYLILGGGGKGGSYNQLANAIAKDDIKKVYLTGDEAQQLAAALQTEGFTNLEIVGPSTTMASLVEKIHTEAKNGDTVLLSPAATSFGLFKNYIDRGNQYIHAVEGLVD